MAKTPKTEARLVAEEFCKKFNSDIPSRTIARTLVEKYPGLYKGIDHARTFVRIIRGNHGEVNRINPVMDKSLFRENRNPEIVGKEYNLMPVKVGFPDYIFPLKHPLILSDVHLPFHDLKAVCVAIDKGAQMGVDSIYLNGDILDCYKISRFFKDGSMMTFNEEREMFWSFIDFLEDALNIPIFMKQGNHCFDDKTEILTDSGFKGMKEISDSDKFATLNTEANQIEFHLAEKVHKLAYNGDMFKISTRGTDMMVTQDHRLYLRYSNNTNNYGIVKASEINRAVSRVTFRASGLLNNPEYTELTDDEIRICAWLHTDGSVFNRVGFSTKYILYQRPEKVHLITDVLDRLGYKYSFKIRNKPVTSIAGKELKNPSKPACVINILRGRGKNTVRLRLDDIIKERNNLMPWISKLSKRQFDIFLGCVTDANGHRRDDGDCIALDGMKTFLDQMQAQCVVQGYRCSMSEYRKGTFRLNIVETDSICVDSFKDNHSFEPYEGEVFCVTVPNGTVVVRRNGKVHISGNCDRWEHYIQQNAPALEDIPEFKLENILKLKELNIGFVESSQICKMGKLDVIHGHEFGKSVFSPVNPARGYFNRAKSSVLAGHCHQTSEHHENNLKRDSMACFTTGALCNLSPKYSPFAFTKWNLGFADVEIEDDGQYIVNNYRIVDGKAR